MQEMQCVSHDQNDNLQKKGHKDIAKVSENNQMR